MGELLLIAPAALQHVPAVAWVNAEGSVLSANAAFRQRLGDVQECVWKILSIAPCPPSILTGYSRLANGITAKWTAEPVDDKWIVVITAEDDQQAAAKAELESFLYVVSHDLRGPLRAIMAAGMILLEDFHEVLPLEGQTELKRQSLAAKKLNNMLEEILKLSRLGRQVFEPKPVDISEVATAVAEDYVAAGATIQVQPGLEAVGSADLLHWLFSILIDNAVKFAKPGSPAQVEVRSEPDGVFVVQDQGMGIPEDYGTQAFTIFERFHGDAHGGLGTGLTFAKRIVERHGGWIELCGRPDEGVTVRFTLG